MWAYRSYDLINQRASEYRVFVLKLHPNRMNYSRQSKVFQIAQRAVDSPSSQSLPWWMDGGHGKIVTRECTSINNS